MVSSKPGYEGRQTRNQWIETGWRNITEREADQIRGMIKKLNKIRARDVQVRTDYFLQKSIQLLQESLRSADRDL